MTHSRRKVQIDRVAFRRDVEAGEKRIVLCEKYRISMATVARLIAEISGKLAGREELPEQAEVDAPEAFDLTLNVPTERLNDLLSAADVGFEELRGAVLQLNPQAKATLVQEILQGRLDRALEPVAVELPKLVTA